MLITDLWKKHLSETPDKTVFVHNQRRVDYRTAYHMVNRYSNVLQRLLGLDGNRTGILLRNCPEFLYTYFAAAQTGNIAVPINHMLKGDEVAYILNHSQCALLVTSSHFLPMLREIRSRIPAVFKIILVDEPEEAMEDDSIVTMKQLLEEAPDYFVPQHPPHPHKIMVYIYTSGTTGFPKPAMISHANLLSNVDTAGRVYGLDGKDVFTCILPMWHNYSITDCCLLPIMLGATIVIGEELDTPHLLQLVEDNHISFLATVPSQLIEMVHIETERPYTTSSLRMVQTGGCALPAGIQEKFRERYNLPIIEGYGLSEASATVSVNPVNGPYKINSVGKVFPNQQVRIVDEKGNPLPPNQEGEIIVRGANVMAGYYGMMKETAEALENGWLHTGDLGNFDDDGYLYIKGRKKEMINVGGFNVYPKEVEAVIYAIDGVMETCVIKAVDPTFGEVVKALVVKKEGHLLDEAAITGICQGKLADYKVPASIQFRPSLPKTGSGKIARRQVQDEASV